MSNTRVLGPARAPSLIPVLNPLIRRLIGAGLPFGPNVLLTVRGRTSGMPRTFPVAIVELDGRRFVQSPFGASHCNVARMTCELASCVMDTDCPMGSYCDEPSGRCPQSSICMSNVDCFSSGSFAQICDIPRTSCEPATCETDPECPPASYCARLWHLCVATSHCTADQDCFSLGLQCDIPRDACRP